MYSMIVRIMVLYYITSLVTCDSDWQVLSSIHSLIFLIIIMPTIVSVSWYYLESLTTHLHCCWQWSSGEDKKCSEADLRPPVNSVFHISCVLSIIVCWQPGAEWQHPPHNNESIFILVSCFCCHCWIFLFSLTSCLWRQQWRWWRLLVRGELNIHLHN